MQVKLTSDQVNSLASGLSSNKRNYKLKPKVRRLEGYERITENNVYLETKNFKIEKYVREKSVRV